MLRLRQQGHRHQGLRLRDDPRCQQGDGAAQRPGPQLHLWQRRRTCDRHQHDHQNSLQSVDFENHFSVNQRVNALKN